MLAIDLVVSGAAVLAKGAIVLLREGNRKEVGAIEDTDGVEVEMRVSPDRLVTGFHKGSRMVVRLRNKFRFFPKYALQANGEGKFVSKDITYEGGFFQGLFHDKNGKYTHGNRVHYNGGFEMGKMSGPGVLQLYDDKNARFYDYAMGTFADDRLYSGRYFSNVGSVVCVVSNGTFDMISSSNNDRGGVTPQQYSGLSARLPQVPLPMPPTTVSDDSERKRPEEKKLKGVAAPQRSGSSAPPPPVPLSIPSTTKASNDHEGKRAADDDVEEDDLLSSSLFANRLSNPSSPLSFEDSIKLLVGCIKKGQKSAEKMLGKSGLVVIGNTGAGKSTAVNYLAGCTLVWRSSADTLEDVLVVLPPAEGGLRAEIMAIGHGKASQTFIPHVVDDLDRSGLVYCDCPGFLDNRGVEINIANSVNIQKTVNSAASVKVLVLINFHSLKADRCRGLSDLLTICTHLFGSEAGLRKHLDSILLGISHSPESMTEAKLSTWLKKDTPHIMEALADRLCLLDPSVRHGEAVESWQVRRSKWLDGIQGMPGIAGPSGLFRTVLTDADERHLICVAEKIRERVRSHLGSKTYEEAFRYIQYFEELTKVEHVVVERLRLETEMEVARYLDKRATQMREACLSELFDNAREILRDIEEVVAGFGQRRLEVDLPQLRSFLDRSAAKRDEQRRKEKVWEEERRKADRNIEELRRLLEERAAAANEELRAVEAKFAEEMSSLSRQLQEKEEGFLSEKEALLEERLLLIRKMDEDLERAKQLNQDETTRKLEAQRKAILEMYQQKESILESERAQQLADQQRQLNLLEGLRTKEVGKLTATIEDVRQQQQQQQRQQQRQQETPPSNNTSAKVGATNNKSSGPTTKVSAYCV